MLPVRQQEAPRRGLTINFKGINMKHLLTNKSLLGATTQYMTITRAVEGGGLRKEYLLRVVEGVHAADATSMAEYFENVITALKEDARYNRNILAFINNCIAHPTKAKTRLALVDEGYKMDTIFTIGRDLKLSDTKLEEKLTAPTATPTGKKSPAVTKLTDGDAPVKVDVKEELNNVRNDVLNHAAELVKLSKDDLLDNILSLLEQVDKLDYTKMNVNRLALVQTYLEKVVG